MSLEEPDEDLLQRIATGESDASRRMVSRKLPRVLAIAVRLLGDRGEAEDVSQEAFLRVWRQAPRWRRGEAKFDTWLHQVVLNLCRDRLRKRRETYFAEPPELTDPAENVEANLLRAAENAGIEAAVASLPDRQREAIVLQYYEELSNIDAAAAMGISVEALESLLARGRRTLRARLAETVGT